MGRNDEYPFSYLKRRKLINMLTEAGFTLLDNRSGKGIYVANPLEDHPRIGEHYLPVAFLRSFYFKLVNLDEPVLEKYHAILKGIHLSVMS